MKTEKIVISFIALIIGIIFAGLAFYFYQSSKVIPVSDTKRVILTSPSPKSEDKSENAVLLIIDSPKDEEVIDKKTVTISGKTAADAIIIISTQTNDQVVTPAANGNFSTTATLTDGVNIIEVTAVNSQGLETKISRMVTFSNESF